MSMRRPASRPVSVAAVLLALSVSGLLVTSTGASADAPVVYGWWSQTALGAGASPTPPDVAPDGMFIQNFPSGPGAVSALEFQLSSQVSAATITLQVTGTPVITQPPVVCPATSRFHAAENGPWSDHPSYDCTHSVTGVVAADQTQVKFVVDPRPRGSTLSLVVLAGGPVDRIAMTKPDFGTLSKTLGQSSSDAGSVVETAPPPAVEPSGALPASPLTEVPTFRAPDLPAVASASQPSASQPSAESQGAAPAAPAIKLAHHADNATIDMIALLLLLLGIIYWSDGFGLLPLRSSRVVQRAWRGRRGPAAAH